MILIIDTYYEEFLRSFYNSYPNLLTKSYAQVKSKLLGEMFGTADFYSQNLTKLGTSAEDLIVNDQILQKKWAWEHGVKFSKNYPKWLSHRLPFFRDRWALQILEAQIKYYKPEVLYVQDLFFPGNDFLSRIKPEIKLIIGQVASAIPFEPAYYSAFDLILTSFPHYINRFKEIGVASQYFPLAFEKDILNKIPYQKREYDVVFVGGFSKYHQRSLENLEYLANNVKLDVWGYGAKKLDLNSPILKNYHGQNSWGKEMYQIFARSKIVINRHVDAAENYANNMRLFEATGMGALLITDQKTNIADFFIPGKEIVTYKDKKELLSKTKYYLKNETERQRIAKAGQSRTLKNYNYQIRMRQLIKILKHML